MREASTKITSHTSIFKALVVVSVVALLFPRAITAAIDCEQKPNHPQCQPGNDADPVTPARITYATGVGNDIEGDMSDGVYEGLNSPDGLEVFIGSQAATGNIFLRQRDPFIDNRTLRINIPQNTCGLLEGAANFPLRFANAKPDTVIPDGVFGMEVGPEHANGSVPMKIMFLDGADEYFINFNPSEPGPCKNQSGYVQVERLPDVNGKRQWTVSPNGTACIEKRQKGKNQLCAGLVDPPMSFSFLLEEL